MSNFFKVNTVVLNKQYLTATGSQLYLNGLLIGSGTYAPINALTNSGVQIINIVNALSGWSASSSNLQSTGSTLYSLLVNESGALNNTILSTGQQAWNAANNNGINLSGNLTLTGQNLFQLSSGTSGNLILSGSNLYNYIIGGDTNLSGIITQTGNSLMVYSNNIGQIISGNVTQSGIILNNKIDSLSGYSDNKFATINNLQSTGQLLFNFIIGGDTNNSGNATQSGIVLRNLTLGGDINLSGNLNNTGIVLYNLITNSSGQYNTNFATISNLQSTGSTLYSYITSLSGTEDIKITNSGIILRNLIIGGDSNLSGNLTITGSTLYNIINNLSGQENVNFAPALANYVYKSGTQIISGNKTFNNDIVVNGTSLFYSNLRFPTINVNNNFSLLSGNYRYLWSGASIGTGTLSTPASLSGFEFTIKNITTGTNLFLSGYVDYQSNYVVNYLQSITAWSDGYSWILV